MMKLLTKAVHHNRVASLQSVSVETSCRFKLQLHRRFRIRKFRSKQICRYRLRITLIKLCQSKVKRIWKSRTLRTHRSKRQAKTSLQAPRILKSLSKGKPIRSKNNLWTTSLPIFARQMTVWGKLWPIHPQPRPKVEVFATPTLFKDSLERHRRPNVYWTRKQLHQ